MTLVSAACLEQRHARHRVVDVPLQPVQIVGEKLEAEILRATDRRRHPMRLAVPLVGPEVEAHLLLPQVVADVHIAQQRQLVAHLAVQASSSGIVSNSMYWWLITIIGTSRPNHLADLARIVSGGVHHDLAADLALRRLDHPLAALAPHAGRRTEPLDPRAHRPRALGQRLRQLRRVDVAVIGIVERPRQVMRLQERIARARSRPASRISRSIP